MYFVLIAAVGLMSLQGRGCPQNEPAGLQWLKKATDGASLYGAGLLALHYFNSKLFSKAAEVAYRYMYIDHNHVRMHVVCPASSLTWHIAT